MTGRIALEGLAFHAHHGVYAHEQEQGNNFEIDLAVETDFSSGAQQDDLTGTVDYEVLYQIVKSEMQKPSRLLETVAEKIADTVMNKLTAVIKIELKLAKLNPPIGGECRKASVTIVKKR